MKCFKLGSIVETRSPKCEENIMKNMKEAYNVTSVIPSSWSWYEHFQGGTTKMNNAIGGIDQGVQLLQLQMVSIDDLLETIQETQQHRTCNLNMKL